MKDYKTILSAMFLVLCGLSLNAQVTIGMGEEPAEGALLQLKENEVADDGPNATKGLEFPRVQLTDENNLYSMFYDKSASDAVSAYKQNNVLVICKFRILIIHL